MASVISTKKGPIVGASTNRVGVVTGDHYTNLQSTGVTDLLKTGAGFFHNASCHTVGTTWTIDVFDSIDGTGNKIWSWVTADGKGPFALQIPFATGLSVTTTGTAGIAILVWS